VGTAGQHGRQINPAGALLAEFGKEHGAPFLKGGELSPELFQLAVDPGQFGPPVTVGGRPEGGRPERGTLPSVGRYSHAVSGMADETARLLAAPPVTGKKLLELSVTWPGLPRGRARMAKALRTFVITWDPLETRMPRPEGFADVNVGSLGLEIAVYLPCWRLTELAAARHQTIADVIGALTGSAVVTAAERAEDVLAGRYTNLVAAGKAPALLANPAVGAALGVPRIQADPQCWHDIGLGAMTDIAEHAFGQVDLDRSQVELAVLPSRQPGCPACAGRRFGFIADLSEAQVSMCPTHRAEADAVTRTRLARADRSNRAGWAALVNATIRRELPHLPNGLATKLAGAEQAMYVQPERDELAERAQLVIEAAGWFPGNARDLGIALGEDPDRALGLPDWLANLVADLGRAGLPDDAIAVGNALARVDPGTVPVIESDIAEALARAGRADEARARTELNLTRWPDDITVRMRAGECLAILGDLDGAAAQFEAALELPDAAEEFEARADAAGELRRIERRRARESGSGRPGAAGQRRQQPSRASRSRRRRQH
jgi:hypothetical protein